MKQEFLENWNRMITAMEQLQESLKKMTEIVKNIDLTIKEPEARTMPHKKEIYYGLDWAGINENLGECLRDLEEANKRGRRII